MSVVRSEALYRSVNPTAEPLTLDEAKAHLRVVGTAEDNYIRDLITLARSKVEVDSRRALLTQTWVLKLDAWPSDGKIVLPWPPLQSVSSIQYIDNAGATQTWSSSNYEVDIRREPGVVHLAYNQTFPSSLRDIQNAITVTFVAGYTTAANVPMPLKQAMRLVIEAEYDGVEQSPFISPKFAFTPRYNDLISAASHKSYP